jgi:hypothetical protein
VIMAIAKTLELLPRVIPAAICTAALLSMPFGGNSAAAAATYAVATEFHGTDIGAQVNAAIGSLGPNGGTVYIPPGTYRFSTTIQLSTVTVGKSPSGSNITIIGAGRSSTVLTYTGAAQALKCTAISVPARSPASGALSDFTLQGSGARGSVGIDIQSCTGVHLDRLSVQDFGAGIKLENIRLGSPAWTERTYIGDVIAYNPGGPDVWFHVDGGTNSFGYTNIVGSHLDGQALLIDTGASLYNSFVQFNSNSGGVGMIEVLSGGSVNDCFFDVGAENTGLSPSSYSVYVHKGGKFTAEGFLSGYSLPVKNEGTFYFYGHGSHADPTVTSLGNYPGDLYTRPVAADDQTFPSVVLAMSGRYAKGTGNAVLMTAGYSDGRSGLRVLNGLTADSPVAASIDNSGVLTLNSTTHPSSAPAGGVAFTSHTATTAAAGPAGPPPSSVAGYLIVNIGGTDYKIPYYPK